MAVDLESLDDATQYEVKLSMPVVIHGDTTLTANTHNVVKGVMLKTFPPESVISADPITIETI